MNIFFRIILIVLGTFFVGAFVRLGVDAIKKIKNANVALGIAHIALSLFLLVASIAAFSFGIG